MADNRIKVLSNKRLIKVRVGKDYTAKFNILHGQRNADLVIGRSMIPLKRIWNRLDSVAVVEPGRYDLIHSFNAIPVFSRRPYVVTFEDYLPRMPEDRPIPWLEKILTRRLLYPDCRAILAMSACAMRQMTLQHSKSPDLPQLLSKTQVLYPSVLPTRESPKIIGESLKLLFVGADFFRKGGPALVLAHKALRATGIPISTTIVSSLNWSEVDYIGPPDRKGVEAAKEQIQTEGITLHYSLPNDAVRRLMHQADFLVLPTIHDTFGYVCLEAMAAGTPVIGTATSAIPEIVEDEVCGFLLDFDNDHVVGKWRWIYRQNQNSYVETYWSTIQKLASSLIVKISNFWESRSTYSFLSAGALAQIDKKFHANRARDRLEEIYDQCVS